MSGAIRAAVRHLNGSCASRHATIEDDGTVTVRAGGRVAETLDPSDEGEDAVLRRLYQLELGEPECPTEDAHRKAAAWARLFEGAA